MGICSEGDTDCRGELDLEREREREGGRGGKFYHRRHHLGTSEKKERERDEGKSDVGCKSSHAQNLYRLSKQRCLSCPGIKSPWI